MKKNDKLKLAVEDLISFVSIVLLATLFVLTQKSMPSLNGDFADGIICIFNQVSHSLKDGKILLWDVHLMGGQPAIGSTIYQVIYPINLVGYILFDDIVTFVAYDYIVHISILGIGLYLLIKDNYFKWWTSLIVTYFVTFNMSTLMQDSWIYLFTGWVWIPIIIWALNRGYRGDRKSWYITSGLFLGMSGLANQGQTLLMNILVICWFYLSKVIVEKRGRVRIDLTIKTFLVGVIGMGICSPALIPAIFYSSNASRFVPGIGYISGLDKMPISSFVEYTTSVSDIGGLVQFSSQNIQNGTPYGKVPLLVSVFLVIGLFRKKRDNHMKLFNAGVFLFVLCYISGLVFPYILHYIPFYNAIREPFLYQPYIVLPIAYYVAEGADWCIKKDFRGEIKNKPLMLFVLLLELISCILPIYFMKSRVVLAVCILLAFLISYSKNRMGRVLCTLLCCICVVLQLYVNNKQMQQDFTVKEVRARVETNVDAMKSIPGINEENGNVARHINFGTLAYSANALEMVNGYDAFGYFNPIPRTNMLAHQITYNVQAKLRNIIYWHTENSEESFYYNLMKDVYNYDFLGKTTGYTSFDDVEGIEVATWKADTNGPAWMVYDIIQAEKKYEELSDDEILAKYNNPEIDFSKQAYAYNTKCDYSGNQNVNNSVQLKEYENNEIVFEVSTEENGLLVTAEVLYPGWNVYVDNEKKEIVHTNYLFRGVEIPKGSHVVKYKYEPLSYRVGIGFLVVTLLLCGVTVIVDKDRKEKIK